MTAIDDALAASRDGVRPQPDAPPEPARRLVVLTCMDARLEPLRHLGLDLGDAHVVRNAGGRATEDALRSLLLSWHVLGTREVLVVHHTDCGVHTDDEEVLRERLEEVTGVGLDGVALHTFADQQESVREDVARIRSSPFAPAGLVVRGAIHDVAAGMLTEV